MYTCGVGSDAAPSARSPVSAFAWDKMLSSIVGRAWKSAVESTVGLFLRFTLFVMPCFAQLPTPTCDLRDICTEKATCTPDTRCPTEERARKLKTRRRLLDFRRYIVCVYAHHTMVRLNRSLASLETHGFDPFMSATVALHLLDVYADRRRPPLLHGVEMPPSALSMSYIAVAALCVAIKLMEEEEQMSMLQVAASWNDCMCCFDEEAAVSSNRHICLESVWSAEQHLMEVVTWRELGRAMTGATRLHDWMVDKGETDLYVGICVSMCLFHASIGLPSACSVLAKSEDDWNRELGSLRAFCVHFKAERAGHKARKRKAEWSSPHLLAAEGLINMLCERPTSASAEALHRLFLSWKEGCCMRQILAPIHGRDLGEEGTDDAIVQCV